VCTARGHPPTPGSTTRKTANRKNSQQGKLPTGQAANRAISQVQQGNQPTRQTANKAKFKQPTRQACPASRSLGLQELEDVVPRSLPPTPQSRGGRFTRGGRIAQSTPNYPPPPPGTTRRIVSKEHRGRPPSQALNRYQPCVSRVPQHEQVLPDPELKPKNPPNGEGFPGVFPSCEAGSIAGEFGSEGTGTVESALTLLRNSYRTTVYSSQVLVGVE
jgi:hypothetical protein